MCRYLRGAEKTGVAGNYNQLTVSAEELALVQWRRYS